MSQAESPVSQGQKQDSPAQCTPLAVLASAVTNVADATLWLGALHWPHVLKHATWDHVHHLCHCHCICRCTLPCCSVLAMTPHTRVSCWPLTPPVRGQLLW